MTVKEHVDLAKTKSWYPLLIQNIIRDPSILYEKADQLIDLINWEKSLEEFDFWKEIENTSELPKVDWLSKNIFLEEILPKSKYPEFYI